MDFTDLGVAVPPAGTEHMLSGLSLGRSGTFALTLRSREVGVVPPETRGVCFGDEDACIPSGVAVRGVSVSRVTGVADALIHNWRTLLLKLVFRVLSSWFEYRDV